MNAIDKNFEITLPGETLTKISQVDAVITFETKSGKTFSMHHDQDCCESVNIHDIAGELDSLLGSPIIEAQETISSDTPEDVELEWQDESATWTTFYLATKDAAVAIRWHGSSNGYYSESVSFVEVTQ